MRIDELWVEAFKNLRDIRVHFDRESPYTVLVGENGSGKSNLLEALALIFRNLDLDEQAPFSYELRYQCRNHDVAVSAKEYRYPKFRAKPACGGTYETLSRRRFMSVDRDGRPVYRPAFVFGYYSGPSDRLASIFEKHQERYYGAIIKPPSARSTGGADANALRRVFYAQTLHGQFALIAFFMEPEGNDGDREFLREHLQIEGLDSVLFALNRPGWSRGGGDRRFWGAVGEVQEFLDRLYDEAMPPLRMDRRMSVDLASNRAIENLYLFLPGEEGLSRVYRQYGDQYSFFTALESMHLSRLLAEVRTRVRMAPRAGGGEMTYRDLSEGEQQLLLVLGLLKFTATEEALFLLDEPDTHLNPAWSTQYLSFLHRLIRQRESCHIVMSSHDPLVFAGLTREQVRVFRRGEEGQAVVEVPAQDPRGMGVAAILTSDLFRLRTTLDAETQKRLDRKHILMQKEDPNDEEQAELEGLQKDLDRLGFARSIRDPLYGLFLEAWTKEENPEWRRQVQLTPEQQRDRMRLASQIVERLRSELVTD
ncbi:MAG: AAA family ATPase [Bryobacterales bacterium]|nr:AAA family ATPase [Bryobacterales bacterium]